MKPFVTLLVVSALLAPAAAAALAVDLETPGAWRPRDVPSGRHLDTSHWFDASHGIVAGAGGRAYVTGDAGVTWKPVHLGLSGSIRDLFFLDDATGIAVDDQLATALTTDGGESWTRVGAGGAFGFFREAWFFNTTHGIVVGGLAILQPGVYFTTDGGVTWDVAIMPPVDEDGQLLGVWFVGETGYAVGRTWRGVGFVYKSVDAGITWTVAADPLGANLGDVAFATPERGVVVGAVGQSYATTDGGESWTRVPVPVHGDLRGVTVTPAGGYLAYGTMGSVVESADGVAWTPAPAPDARTFRTGAAFADGSRVVAGDGGAVWVKPARDTPESLVDAFVPKIGTPRPPVTIIGDDGFRQPGSGVTRGNGTADDPFVIEGHDIVPSTGPGILVVNTRAHVLVRGNAFHDGAPGNPGVRLVDAANVRVEDNAFERNDAGLVAEGTRNLRVHANAFTDNAGDAVAVVGGRDLHVTSNDFTANGAGARVDAPEGAVVVARNAFASNAGVGLAVAGTAAAPALSPVVSGNAFEDNGVGARLVRTADALVEANTFLFSERDGLDATDSTGVTVTGNGFAADGEAGAHLTRTTDALLTGNRFTAGGYQVRLDDSARVVLRENEHADGERRGVLALGGGDVLIADSTFKGGSSGVVAEEGTRGLTLRGNEFLDVAFATFAWGAHDVTITDNTYRPVFGAFSSGQGASNVMVEGNRFVGGNADVSIASDTAGARIANNSWDDATHAIHVVNGAHDVVVEDNVLLDGRAGPGMVVGTLVKNVTVRNNVLRNVTYAGIIVNGWSERILVQGNVIDGVLGASSWGQGEGVGILVRGDTHGVAIVGNEVRRTVGPAMDVEHDGFAAPSGRIDGNLFADAPAGVRIRGTSAWSLTGNSFENLPWFGLNVTADGGTVDARNNWWGTADGPGGLGPGSGARVIARGAEVLFDPWSTAANHG